MHVASKYLHIDYNLFVVSGQSTMSFNDHWLQSFWFVLTIWAFIHVVIPVKKKIQKKNNIIPVKCFVFFIKIKKNNMKN